MSLPPEGRINPGRDHGAEKSVPMTIVEIDTTATIVEAARILFRNDPVTDRKLRTWNIGRLLSLFWPST
jgi:hypothetical protein